MLLWLFAQYTLLLLSSLLHLVCVCVCACVCVCVFASQQDVRLLLVGYGR